jgi:hypothetical protein
LPLLRAGDQGGTGKDWREEAMSKKLATKAKAKRAAIEAHPHGTMISNCIILPLTDKQMKLVREFLVALTGGTKP